MHIAVMLLIAALFLPVTVFAQGGGGVPLPPGGGGGIANPLSVNTISGLLARIINFLLGAAAMVAMLALVFGGLKMIGVFVSEDNVKEGKKIILWAVIGLAVIMIAFVIIRTVSSVLGGA